MSNSRPTIICATRGGAGSYVAQTAARRRAERLGARLLFVYVVTPTSFAIDASLRPALRHELHWLGRALVALAAQRGRQQGLRADVDVREGELRGELIAAVRDHSAGVLILGAPRGTTASMGDDEVERLARAIAQETGVETIIARPEDAPADMVGAPFVPAPAVQEAQPGIMAARLRPLATREAASVVDPAEPTTLNVRPMTGLAEDVAAARRAPAGDEDDDATIA